jgi:hypothetical protein
MRREQQKEIREERKKREKRKKREPDLVKKTEKKFLVELIV